MIIGIKTVKKFVCGLLIIMASSSLTKTVSAAEIMAGILAAATGKVERKSNGSANFSPLNNGDKIYLNDEIRTGKNGRIQILLMDETTFSIGSDSALVIDEFIYDPSTQTGAVDVDIKAGVFRFISGRIAKANPMNMNVKAGNAVISIRGTEVIGTVIDGKSEIVLLSGAIDIMATTDVCVSGGSNCMQTITRPGFGVALNDNGRVSPPSRIDVEDISKVVDSLDTTPAAAEESEEDQPSENNDTEATPEAPSNEENSELDADGNPKPTFASAPQILTASLDEEDEIEVVENKVEENNEDKKVSGFDLIILKSLGLVEEGGQGDNKQSVETQIIDASKPENTNKEKEDYDPKPEEQVDEIVENDVDKIEEEKQAEAAQKEETKNSSPVLGALNNVEFKDTSSNDTFAVKGDESKAKDADNDELKFSVAGMSVDTSRSGYTHSVSGEYGQLFFDEVSGKYTYVPDDSKIEGLKENTSESFSVTVSDNEASDTQTLLIAISGTNDTPELASVTAVSLSDTAGDDDFNAINDELKASDRDDETFTYSATDMVADTSEYGYTHSVSGDYGTLYLNSTSGAYTYIPDDAAIEGLKTSETDSFTVTASDGSASASQTLTANITGVNDTPTLSTLTALSFTDTAADNTYLAETGSTSASDRDSDTLTYSATDMVADTSESGYTHSVSGDYGTLYLNSSSGAYTYIPDDAAIEGLKTSESDAFTLTASDGSASASQTLTANITGANDTPTLASLAAIAFTDTAADNTFSAETGSTSASDRDSDTLTYSATDMVADTSQSGYTHSVSGDYGTLYLNSTSGAYTYIPDDAAIEGLKTSESDAFTLTASDGSASASQTLTANITGANDTPTLSTLTALSFTDTAADNTFLAETGSTSASDRDSDTLTYSATGMTADTSQSGYTHSVSGDYGTLYLNATSGAYTYIPDDAAIEGLKTSESDAFTLTASDGTASASQTLTANITGANDTPTLSTLTALSFTDTAADNTFSAATGGTSASDRDADTLTYSATGMTADTSQSGYTHSVSGDYGTLYLNSSSGAYTYIPDDAAIEGLKTSETDSFTVTASDGSASASQTLTANITGANDTPTLSTLTALSFTDTAADNTFSAETGSTSASDRDSDTLTYSATDMVADTSQSGYTHSVSGDYGTLYLNSSSGAYTYIPDDAAIEGLKTSETDSFTVTASDGSASASQTLTANITGVNDTPTLSTLTALSFTDTAADNTFSAATGGTSASDRDADTLTYSATGMTADTSQSGYTHSVSGDYGTLYLNSSSGAYTYIPDDAAIEGLKTSESDAFTLTASDGSASASQTLTANITGANDTPTLSTLTALSFTDTAADNTFSAATGGTSASDRDSDTLTYSATDMVADTSQSGYTHSVSGDYGTLYLNSTSGAYTYIPDDAAIEGLKTSESDAFTLTASDGSASASQTLTANITGANDTPTLSTLTALSFTDTAADNTFSAETGSTSASDRDSDTLTYSATDMVADTSESGYTHSVLGDYGTLYLNSSSGAYTYIPDDAAIEGLKTSETDSFTVTASDGSATASQTLTANITGVNDTPTLASLAAIAFTDTAADNTFSAETGSTSASDRDSDTLTYSATDMVADTSESGYTHSVSGDYGKLYLNSSSGAYTYIPDDAAIEGLKTSETDSFTVTASDGTASASQTLTANITGVNDTPTLASLAAIAFTDTAADNTFSAETGSTSASDRDSDTLTYSATDMVADTSESGYTHSVSGDYGTLYLNSSSGAYTYIPDDAAIEGLKTSESDAFTLTASDGSASASQTLTANITGANDTPTLASLAAIAFTDTANNDSFSAESATASASDRDSDTLSFSVTDMASNTSQSGYTHSVSGDYGTLYLNSSSGAYTYIPGEEAIEGLKTTETDVFTLTASDGSASASQTLTATITGVNDTPTLADLSSLSFTDTASDDTFTTSTGTAQGNDRDVSDTLTYGIDGGSSTSVSGFTYEKAGTYGVFYINASTGQYQFIPRDSAIEGLSDSANEIFGVTVTDADGSVTESDITVSITGANDTPTLASLAAIAYSDTTGDDSFGASSGTASGADRDTGTTLTYSIQSGVTSTLSNYNTMLAGTYGTLHINESTGDYRYVPVDSSIEGVKGDVSEDFTVLVDDGDGSSASSTISVNITGADDTPILNIANAIIPSSVSYDETSITSDNLLNNPSLSSYASGWTRKGYVCSSASTSANTCSRINDGTFYAGPVTGGLSQTINPVEILNLSDEQAAKGGTVSWSTEVWMGSVFCSNGSWNSSCADTVSIEVSGKGSDGKSLLQYNDQRTQYSGWETWSKTSAVNKAPVEITYSMSGKDHTYWGCSANENVCKYGPQMKNPSVTYTYTVDDDIVISTLNATDSDDDDEHSYTLVSDSSNNNIFEIRGNQLILVGGSSVAAAGDDVYDLVIGITDDDGNTVNADVSISVSDAANVPQQIAQQIASTEDSEYSVVSDFGSGSVASDDLPSWLSLVDSGNGRAVISGTAPNSGEVSFSVYSIQDGEKTTARYVMTVGESCTSAYCERFVSSDDTINLKSYTLDGDKHQIGDTQYYHFNDWASLYSALSSGTGVFERSDIDLTASDGTWEGNLRLSIDYGSRTIDSSTWGTFSSYNGGNSGSFRIEENANFSASNGNCSKPGECTIFGNPQFEKTCTGSTCNASENAHGSVDLYGVGTARLLTDNNNGYGMIGSLSLNDRNNSGSAVAETAGDGLVLESQ